MGNWEPLGILQISAVLKQHNFDCELIIPELEKDWLQAVQNIKPDIILYSTTTGLHNEYLKMNKLLKSKLNFVSVFGGLHPTFFPKFIDEDSVDVICRGEGEEAIVELAEKLEENEDITKIKNLWVKKDGEIYENEMRDLIQNLDDLPFPDRYLTRKYEYFRKKKSKTFIASRGCPYKCTYCFNHAYKKLYKDKGTFTRFRSPENVVEEIKKVRKEFGIKRVIFQDDIFILNREWFKNFTKLYSKEVKLPYFCHVRSNLIDEEIVKLLKDSNCYAVDLAAESGNDFIRNNLLKRYVPKEQIIYVSKLFRKYKLRFIMQNMLCLPTEDLDKALETLKLNIECKPTYAWASIFQPYPKTELAEYSIKNELMEGQIGNYYYYDSPLKVKDKREMENLQRFFDVTVHHPYLLPLVKQLIKLPKNRIFDLIFQVNGAIKGIKIGLVEPSLDLLKVYKRAT